MHQYTLNDIAHLLNCEGSFPCDFVNGYFTDSRLTKPGGVFFALKGEREDGHAFLKEIASKGALGAVVSKEYEGEIEGLYLLKVSDPLHSLQKLARERVNRLKPRIVGVTGSLGKTTTKGFIATLLARKFLVACNPGNQNSQVGLPLTILDAMKGNEEILVLEMGMTKSGHLTKLLQIATPEVAVITSVALVHAENFDSIESIGRAKGEIFSHPFTGLGILNRSIPNYEELLGIGGCKKHSFSVALPADYTFEDEHLKEIKKKCRLPGEHNLSNLLAAVAVARYFGMTWEEINAGASDLLLPEKRLQIVKHQDKIFVNDSYNAAEQSIKAALLAMPEPEGRGRKIAVLGSMRELGKFSASCHASVGKYALDKVDLMYCLGEECLPIRAVWQNAGRPVKFFHHRQELALALKADLQQSDVILLKGSRPWELWKLLEEL